MCADTSEKQDSTFTTPTTPPPRPLSLSLSLSLTVGSSSMEKKPRFEPETQTPQALSPSSSGRRSNDPNSPEFEFWMIRNPSFPQPHLLSADELFVDGFLLPLDLISPHSESDPPNSNPKINPETTPNPEPEPEPGSVSEPGLGPESGIGLSTSKRWRDIFKIGDKKPSNNQEDRDLKEKKKERRTGNGSSAGAELNINIWPFLRSRSAGNGGNRPKIGGGASTRKVSSAPCSRSNSSGESKLRKWPNSPSRGGIHLGRSSPVWQVRRGGSGSGVRRSEPVVRSSVKSQQSKSSGGGGGRARVLNLNVPMCIGYRQQMSCRSDENSLVCGGGETSSGGAGNSGTHAGVKLFNLRTLFSSKKVY